MKCVMKLECETYLPYVSGTQQYESRLDPRLPAYCVQVYELCWAARFGNGECDENRRGVGQLVEVFDFIRLCIKGKGYRPVPSIPCGRCIREPSLFAKRNQEGGKPASTQNEDVNGHVQDAR